MNPFPPSVSDRFPSAAGRHSRRRARRWAFLLLLWLGWSAGSGAATDPRVVERYREMLAANPREGTVLERLWKIALEEGKTQEWLAGYAAAGEKGDFSARMIQGLFLRRSGKGAEALEAFRQAAALKPESPLPLQAMAGELPPEERAQALEKALSLLPEGDATRPETLQALGDAWMAAGEPRKAAGAWEGMLKNAANPQGLRSRLAELYAGHGMPEEAIAHYRVLEKEGDPAARTAAYRAHARLLEGEGKAREALERLERALDLVAPDHWLYAEVAQEMIRLARRTGQTEALGKRWRAAAGKGNPQALALLAMLQESEGDTEALRATLEELAAQAPDDLDARIRLARLSRKEGRREEAARRLDEVLAANPPHREELVLERAALDLAAGNAAAARQRLENGLPEDETWNARRIAFYEEHRMFDALEARLRRPGGDPVALAEFLFSRKRPEEAREALGRLVRSGDPEAARAQAHLKIAGILRQHQDDAGAIAALEAAIALQPGEAAYPMALGDLYLKAKRFPQARERLQRAYALAATPEARLEADQRLFQTFEGGGATPEEGDPSGSDAARAMETILSAPVAPLPGGVRGSSRNPELIAFIQALGRDTSEEGQIRHARWQFWNRDLYEARATVARLLEKAPDSIPAHQLALAIARATNDREAALKTARLLAERLPRERARYLREVAQILLQYGNHDEALPLLEELAGGGDTAALTDLANAQQQAQRWYDALATWQRLYGSATPARRVEILPALARAMEQLGMHESRRDLLWEALNEQGGDPVVLRDLITACRERGQLPWLEEKLRAGASAPTRKPWQPRALAEVLKARGQSRQAYETLREAAEAVPDRAAAQAGLVAECESLYDFAAAARHQRLRLRFLAEPGVDEWLKLASLEAAALEDEAAGATWEEVVRRFPRQTEALLAAARYLEPLSRARALEIVRQAYRGEPESVPAALLLLRWSGQPAEVTAAAGRILESVPPGGDQLILPPAPASIGNRLRALFSMMSPGGSSAADAVFFHERMPGRSEPHWRLEAIRALARQVSPEGRAAWMERWREALPSETLWAAVFAGADEEASALLLRLAARPGAGRSVRAALVWELLRQGDWGTLARWLWAPERLPEDHDLFRGVFSEWALLNEPIPVETLFAAAPATWLEPIAVTLAGRNRFAEAAAIGGRIAPVGGRSGFDYLLAQWLIGTGNRAQAQELLRSVAAEPADLPDAPTYSAQRVLYLLFSKPERDRWSREVAAAHAGSPLHSALTRALLAALAGEAEPMKTALDELLQLRPTTGGQGTVADRVWSYRLMLGARFAGWNLDEAARYFWEKALEDPAAVAMEGPQSAAFTREMAMRLMTLQLADMEPDEARRSLNERLGDIPTENLTQLNALLESGGFRSLARIASQEVWKRSGASGSIARIIADSRDSAFLETAIAAWEEQPEADLIASPVVLNYLAGKDRPRAIALARKILTIAPADQRVRELLARYYGEQGQWAEAAAAYRELIEAQATHPHYRVGLAEALFRLGQREKALATLREAPRRAGELDARRAILLAQLDQLPEAFRIGEELARGSEPALLIAVARAFAGAGKEYEGLVLLIRAVGIATEADKPRAAYEYQREAILLAGPRSPHAPRWLARLHQLADRPEFLSDWFDFSRERLPVAARLERMREGWAHGSEIAGAWLVGTLLESGDSAQAAGLLPDLLRRRDTPAQQLDALEKRFRASGLLPEAAEITGELYRRTMMDMAALIRHARALQQAGRREEALGLLERGATLALFEPAWNKHFAPLALELGDLPLARRLLLRAVNADPAALEPTVHLAWITLLLKEGDPVAAKHALRRLCGNPENRPGAAIVAYLRASGRLAPGAVEAELRDLALTPEQLAEVHALLEKEKAAPEGTPSEAAEKP